MVHLLDVNALIALVDSDHVSHEAMHAWFASHAQHGWATCPLTENGMVRVLSQPTYPSGQRTPSEVIDALRYLKAAHAGIHQFWPDDVTLTDDSLSSSRYITGSRHVTDVYLLGLTTRHGGRVVTFDRSMPWQAIRGATRDLIVLPASQ